MRALIQALSCLRTLVTCGLTLLIVTSAALAQHRDASHASSTEADEGVAPFLRAAPPAPGSSTALGLAQSVSSPDGESVLLQGNVELWRDDLYLRTPALRFDQPSQQVESPEKTLVRRGNQVLEGDGLQYDLERERGSLQGSRYYMGDNHLNGRASQMEWVGDKVLHVRDMTMSSCRVDDPQWELYGAQGSFDFLDEYATVTGARLRFLNTTLFALPYIGFPISDKRHSGLLSPQIGYDGAGGFHLATPYYLNIAPNQDATLTPRLYTKRGLMGSAEYRYLTPWFNSQFNVDWLPQDQQTRTARLGWQWQQNGRITDTLRYGFNQMRVSDNGWWSDFPDASPAYANRLLNSHAELRWSHPFGTLVLDRDRYQIQQSDLSPVSVPYSRPWRLHQDLVYRFSPNWDLTMPLEVARFAIDSANQPQGERSYALPRLNYRLNDPGYSALFSVGALSNRYRLDDGTQLSNTVPMAVLGGNLVLERNLTLPWLGAGIQTLEPALYYNYAPYRDQSQQPVFDTTAQLFTLDSLGTDNTFSGYDRVADANTLTAAATSRFFDTNSGRELGSFTLGQRWRRHPQRVTLPGQAVEDVSSGVLLAFQLRPLDAWRASGSGEYSRATGNFSYYDLALGYATDQYKSLTLAQSYNLSTPLYQTRFSWQWPFSSRWYSAGSVAFSHLDRRITSALIGFEVLRDCWVLRFGVDAQSLSPTQITKRLLLQLEFTGFGRVGINPIPSMQALIPNYRVASPTLGPPDWVRNLPPPTPASASSFDPQP